MKKIFKILLRVFLALLFVLACAIGIFIYKAKHGINFYESTPPTLPEGIEGNTVLLFSKTNGFRHGDAIKASIPAFEKMASDNGWVIFQTNNGAIFNPEQLQKFDVVIWNNTSGRVLKEEQREHFQNYIESGGGFVGIHAAGDASHHWDWYQDYVIGAHFSHHTMNPQFQKAPMYLEKSDDALIEGLLPIWEREEEWYMFSDNPRDAGYNILYTVDESNINPSGKIPILASDKDWGMGDDHPIVWSNTVKQGRVFYSALGHSGSAFSEPNHLLLLENAITWAGKF